MGEDVSAPLNTAGSDFSPELGREDPEPDPRQFPRFRGPPPRLRPPPPAAEDSPTAPEPPADPQTSPSAIPILPPAPPLAPLLQPSTIEAAKERIKALVSRMERRTIEDALEIGREALRINRALGHGEIGQWLRDAFGQRRARTIYNWMRMFEYAEARPEEFATFSILQVSAVYLLTAPKAPRDAIETIVRQIGAGNIPSVRAVRAEIARASQCRADAPLLDAKRPAATEALKVELAQGGSADAQDEERGDDGLAALEAVAQLIAAEDREYAIGLLREAAEGRYGLRDLMRILSDASGPPESVVARWR